MQENVSGLLNYSFLYFFYFFRIVREMFSRV